MAFVVKHHIRGVDSTVRALAWPCKSLLPTVTTTQNAPIKPFALVRAFPRIGKIGHTPLNGANAQNRFGEFLARKVLLGVAKERIHVCLRQAREKLNERKEILSKRARFELPKGAAPV